MKQENDINKCEIIISKINETVVFHLLRNVRCFRIEFEHV